MKDEQLQAENPKTFLKSILQRWPLILGFVLISFFIIYTAPIVWVHPHVGEIWVLHNDNPFDRDIRCKVIAVTNGWVAYQWFDDDSSLINYTNSHSVYHFTECFTKTQ
jgi:hypothetical protein